MDLSLSQRIKKYIDLKKITQESFGRPLGVGKSSVGQWVNGKTEPSAAKKIQILKEYPDLNPRWFLFGQGNMTNDVAIKPDEDDFSNLVKEDSTLYRFISKQTSDLDSTFQELLEAKDSLISMQTKHIESLERTILDKVNNMFTKSEVDEKVRVAVELAVLKSKQNE